MNIHDYAIRCRNRIRLYRNTRTLVGSGVKLFRVNLEYWDNTTNLGDCLSPVIVEWMLSKKNIKSTDFVGKTKHLYAVGSIIGMGELFDATVWGSGVHTREIIDKVNREKSIRKYDIRAVRGPRTAEVMRNAGYECPDIYGDPAILMPYIYPVNNIEKKYDVSIIHHFTKIKDVAKSEAIHNINIMTKDYAGFIDEICRSKLVISSSLHGLILAESYGIPAVFLNEGLDGELLKFYDWYNSSGREDVRIAHSLEEALKLNPMDLPNLEKMRQGLIESFPYDLWHSHA